MPPPDSKGDKASYVLHYRRILLTPYENSFNITYLEHISRQKRMQQKPNKTFESRIRNLQIQSRNIRCFSEVETTHGISIPTVSLQNAVRVLSWLAKGEAFVAEHRVGTQKQEVASPLDSPSQANSVLEIVTAEEKPLIDFIGRNLCLKHASNAAKEIAKSQSLVSVKLLSLGNNAGIRHTNAQSGMDNNAFFTLGIGDHPVTPFLDDAEMVATINIQEVRQSNPAALSGLWVSPHLSPFVLSRQEATVQLGDTYFHMSHSWKDMSKTYHYRRANGEVYQRTVKFRDEVYIERDLDRAIAHEFILHLRFIGGSYQQHILSTINDQTISEEQKLKIISTAITAIMPGWITLEAKIPVLFSIQQKGVRITYQKRWGDYDFRRVTQSFFDQPSERAGENFLRHVQINRYDCFPSPIVTALSIQPHHFETVNQLLRLGFSLNGRASFGYIFTKSLSSLQLGFQKRSSRLCQFLLSAQQVHPSDPHVRIGLIPPEFEDLKLLVTNEELKNPPIEMGHVSPHFQNNDEDPNIVLIYQMMDRQFPFIRHFSLPILANAVANGFKNLAIYILKTVTKEILLHPNINNNTPPEILIVMTLHAAAIRGYIDIIKLMLAQTLVKITSTFPGGHYVTVNEDKTTIRYSFGGNTCLHYYLRSQQNLDEIRFLIESGIDPKSRNEQGETASSILLTRIADLKADRDYKEALDIKENFDVKVKEWAAEKKTTVEKLHENGDIEKAKAFINYTLRQTEEKIRVLNECLDYLVSLEAHPTPPFSLSEQCEYQRSTVSIVIVGRTPKGEKFVVFGEKQKKKDPYREPEPTKDTLTELVFPGGLKEIVHIDHTHTMFEEVKEETGIDLRNPFWSQAKISHHFVYKKTGAGTHGTYHHEVFLVDLGEQLFHARLYARDDLWKLHKVPVSKVAYDATADPQQRFQLTLHHRRFFLRHSNAKSLETVCSLPAYDDYTLEALFDLEFDGYYMSCDAAARGDIAELERLKAYGALLQPKDYDHRCTVKTIPVREAVVRGHLKTLQWFINNNYDTDYINNDNLYSAAVNHDQFEILQFLCDNKISLGQMWSALYDAHKAGKIDYLMVMLTCLVQNLDTNTAVQESDSLESLESNYNVGANIAIQCGFKEIASQLIRDRRIKAYRLSGYDKKNAYFYSLQHGWFDLIFEIVKLEIQEKVSSLPNKPFLRLTIQKTELGYRIQTHILGEFSSAQEFDKANRFFHDENSQRVFNLLILDHLCSLRQKPQSQTSNLTHFKPNSDNDLINFATQLGESKSPGHEIATALLTHLQLKPATPPEFQPTPQLENHCNF